MIRRKNVSHYSGPYYVPQYEIYRDGVWIGIATKTGTSQDNYPWDWELAPGVKPAWDDRTFGHAGLLSEAIQEIEDAAL